MTSGTYRKAMAVLSDEEIYNFAERLCEYYKFDPSKNYPQTVDSEILNGAAKRMLYLHRACDLLRRAIFLGATKHEVYQIAQYLITLMKSTDYKLDFRKCESEMLIKELMEKYNENDFLALEIDGNELEEVINRDKDFYAVKIKSNV